MSSDNKTITIADVAEALGVSKTTVSRAISGKGRIGNATKERVIRYIEEHDYKPNVIAKSLAQSKTYNIGVVMPGDYELIDLPFFQNCLMGIQQIASSQDYDILLTMCTNMDISQLERVVRNRKVDGVILMRTFLEDKPTELLLDRKIPFVVVGTSNYEKVIQIDNDHRAACREMTSILLMKRLKKIALLGGNESHVVTQNRLGGFLEAFEEMGEMTDRSLIYLNADNQVLVDKAVDEILEKNVECIVCMDDSICTHVMNKLKREHIKVPEHVKVASFYNSSVLENNIPSITSLSFDAKELGMVSCSVLMDVIQDKTVIQKTLKGYEVILKESTK